MALDGSKSTQNQAGDPPGGTTRVPPRIPQRICQGISHGVPHGYPERIPGGSPFVFAIMALSCFIWREFALAQEASWQRPGNALGRPGMAQNRRRICQGIH